jgi:hypothetical protein
MADVDALKSGLVLAAAFFVLGLRAQGRLSRLAAALLVVGLTAVDLWGIDRKIMDPQTGSAAEYAQNFTETPDITFLKKDPTEFRILPLRWDDTRYSAYGIGTVLGYHPAKPRLYQAFMDTAFYTNPSLRIMQFLNVKYVMADGYYPDSTAGVKLRADGPVKVYEIEGALPRAYVVHAIVPVRNDSDALAYIRASASLDPRRQAVWSEPPPYPHFTPPAEPDSVTRIRYDMNGSEYMVRNASPGLFVQVDQWDPDWRATVDGEPATIHRVDYLLRGILLPPGVHRVRLWYMPAALEAGIKVSAASAIATILVALAGLWMARRRRTPAAPAEAGRA